MMYFLLQCKDFGYKEVYSYLEGELNLNEMIEKLKMESRRYAKRQITWFKKNKDIYWLDGEKQIEENINIIRRSNLKKEVH